MSSKITFNKWIDEFTLELKEKYNLYKKRKKKKIHVGSLYIDDIKNILLFLEKNKIIYQFRVLERPGRWQISNTTFKSIKQFEEYIETYIDFNDYIFTIFQCICLRPNPLFISWFADLGKIEIIQAFQEDEMPSLSRDNLILPLKEHIRSNREPFWFRLESKIYYYTSAIMFFAILFFGPRYRYIKEEKYLISLFLLWFVFYIVFYKITYTIIDKFIGPSWGYLSEKKMDQWYIKKSRRAKMISKPLRWVFIATLGAVLSQFVVTIFK